jgi:hypothetical protein
METPARLRDRPGQPGTGAPDEYLAAENRILRANLPARLCLSDPERSMLAEIGKQLWRKALAQIASVARPDTILAWCRKLIAHKFDGSQYHRYPGRPRIESKLETLIVQMAKENSGGGYDRIVGMLASRLQISDQRPTIGAWLCDPRRECSEAPRDGASAEAEPDHDLEAIHSIAYGGVGRYRFLHRRGPYLSEASDVLHIVLHSSGEPPRKLGRDYSAPRPSVDATDGTECDRGRVGMPESASIRIA